MPRGGPRTNAGGPRPNAGRPRTRLTLDKETARTLHTLTLNRRMVAPDVTEEAIVSELVEREWRQLDADFQERAAGG